jgi:hypothetical protein
LAYPNRPSSRRQFLCRPRLSVLQLNPQRRSRLPRQLLCSPLQALRLPSRQYRPFLWCSLQRNRNL